MENKQVDAFASRNYQAGPLRNGSHRCCSQKTHSLLWFFRYHRICHLLCQVYFYSDRCILLVNGNEQICNFAHPELSTKKIKNKLFLLWWLLFLSRLSPRKIIRFFQKILINLGSMSLNCINRTWWGKWNLVKYYFYSSGFIILWKIRPPNEMS